MASANMEPEPVIAAATVLVTAIPKLASSANKMDLTEAFCDDIILLFTISLVTIYSWKRQISHRKSVYSVFDPIVSFYFFNNAKVEKIF